MRVFVWLASLGLGIVLLVVGIWKLVSSPSGLDAMAPGVPAPLMYAAGVAEVLGGLGVVAPAATRRLPVLTPIAAACVVLEMVIATITEFVIGDPVTAAYPILIGLVAAFVAWARFGPYAVSPR